MQQPEYILVAFGTDAHPFERALDVVGRLRPAHRLVVQHGHTPARDWPDVTWHPFVPFETLRNLMRDASCVVCHAGVGTIMTALSFHRRPVVIARLSTRGEHVDDHQLQIVATLAERGLIVPVDEEADIEAAVEVAGRSPVEWQHEPALARAVVAAVEGKR
jgi:UDP-N-acetylglucosamine--N-acetylmuramyl-(pentapeptide) pyrophosphoryl-undecaprenol N-acetylglucosamine transferase